MRLSSLCSFHVNLICVWPCIISVGKVIQRNQLDATITIYWSSRSAQHVSGNLLPIYRSVRLRFFYSIGYSGRKLLATCKQLPSYRTRSATLPLSEPLPTTTTRHYTICCKKNLSLTLLKMDKNCLKHVELILRISKLLLLHLVGFSIVLYPQFLCICEPHFLSQENTWMSIMCVHCFLYYVLWCWCNLAAIL